MGLSEAYDDFQRQIIDPIISQVVYDLYKKGVVVALDLTKATVGSHPYNKIKNFFLEYSNHCKVRVYGSKIDRHKIASSMCGAVLRAEPLLHKDRRYRDYVNSSIALIIGVQIIKVFMIQEKFEGYFNPTLKNRIINNFDMEFLPLSRNKKDVNPYQDNLINGIQHLRECSINAGRACERFDIWAYSTIYFHIEEYNSIRLDEFCSHYN